MSEPKTITVKEAAEKILEVSDGRAHQIIARAGIPRVRVGRNYVVDKAAVVQFARQRRLKPKKPKKITVTVEKLVAFASKVEASTDYDGCLSSCTAEELVAEFFGVEVPPRPAPPQKPHGLVLHGFTANERADITRLIAGFTDEMALAKLVKR